jgi:hypothetical protein
MPVLNLAQDSVNILGHGELAQGGIGIVIVFGVIL